MFPNTGHLMNLLERLTRDHSLFIETCTVQLWNIARIIFADRKHFQVSVSSHHFTDIFVMWYKKEKGDLERTSLWGLAPLHKTWLNNYNKSSCRNLGHLQKLEKYLWLFCSFLWQRCLHPSWSLGSHLFDHKREAGAQLQAKKKKCRAQFCHFYQSVLALFVLWDRCKWEF